MDQKTLKKIIFLAVLGILVSAYLLKVHYSEGSQLCDVGDTFSCTDVNNSKYSQMLGLPVALYGLLAYFLIGLTAVLRHQKESWLRSLWARKIFSSQNLFYLSFITLIVSLYLTYIEFFIIKTLCLFCLISFGIIILISIYTYKNLKVKKTVEHSF